MLMIECSCMYACTVYQALTSEDICTLDVDVVSPDLLFCSRRESTDAQDILHLLVGNEHDVASYEPAQTFRARWASK